MPYSCRESRPFLRFQQNAGNFRLFSAWFARTSLAHPPRVSARSDRKGNKGNKQETRSSKSDRSTGEALTSATVERYARNWRIAMKSVNHKSKPKSSQPVDGEFDEMPLPPMLRPHCGIWAEPGRVEIMFRLDGLTSYQHIIVEVPPKDGSLPEVKGQGAESIPL